jgi:transposase
VYLSDEERGELLDLLRHPRTPVKTRERIHLVLQSDDNRTPEEIARTSHLSRSSVYSALKAFLHQRLASLFERDRPGRRPRVSPEMEVALLELVCDQERGHTIGSLRAALLERFSLDVPRSTLNDHLRRMGLSWQGSRYVPGGQPEPEMTVETVLRLDTLKGGPNSACSS